MLITQAIAQAIERTLRQIAHWTFLRVLALGLLLSVAALLLAGALAAWAVGEGYTGPHDWLNTLLAWAAGLLTIWLGYVFFVPLSSVVIGMFLDPVVDTVEERFYPHRRAGPPLGLARACWLGVRLGAIILIANLAVIPLYLLTIWIPFFAVALFYGLNAYLLGWGFYDLVATRHFAGPDYTRMRKSMRGEQLLFGLLVTVLYMVPILNLAMPILATAMMVHLLHGKLEEGDEPVVPS